MIYPKDVIEFIKDNEELRKRFPSVAADHPLHIRPVLPQPSSSDFEKWMWEEGVTKSPAIQKYIFFLSWIDDLFKNILFAFEGTNPGREEEKDSAPIATSPQEMFFIGRYLYYLASHSVLGDVLECGCFKGFSSCCLSWVCDYLGRKLIIADSFQGLPDVGHSYYKEHDFKGEFETVKSNLNALGCLRSVEFIPGWYNQSLVGFARPICLLWMDVDLYQSAIDVLNNVFPCIDAKGVIFSHEFNMAGMVNGQVDAAAAPEPVRAIDTYLKSKDIPYRAKYLTKNLGIVIPNCSNGDLLLSRDKTRLQQGYRSISNVQALPPFESLMHSDLKTMFWIDEISGMAIEWNDSDHGKISGDRAILQKWDEISVTGWAIDQQENELAGGVYIDIDGKLFPSFYGTERGDVAKGMKSARYLHCGYEAAIPMSKLQKGPHNLSIKILARDRKAYYSPGNTVTFIIK